ncbi:hypothetical protein E3226_001260 [Legionella geestiana]|uniref:hypothetical protein n=1 Tax=Legionella geestiana TaxID=45065 RepID=UPI0010923D0B|nr:hypothetical protein [Legionella geestiana]QDQ39129.1 hypothetical protein E3226_001260 [Legionella geestiana]
MNKLLIGVLTGSIFSSVALSSPCDKLSLSISGPSHYQYTLNLSKGTVNKKKNGDKVISNKIINPTGDFYKVFSGKGTRGNVRGVLHITNLDSNSTVSFAFDYIAHGSSCFIYPKTDYREKDNFVVFSTGVNDSFLKFQIKEYR